MIIICHYRQNPNGEEDLKGKIFVLLVSTTLLVGMLSGCVEGKIEADNAPAADFEWSPKTSSVNKTVEFTSTPTDADGDELIIQHNL